MRKAALLFVALPLAAVVAPPQNSAVFHSGTRLVEVEVVVRGKQTWPSGFVPFLKAALDSGPPFGPPGAPVRSLTKDDFAVFDEGKSQPISIFHAGPIAAETMTAPLPPGAVSNRFDTRGQPVNSTTVILGDFLDSGFDLTEYARIGMTNLLRSVAASSSGSHFAVYSLGEKLHLLHDFTDDPAKLNQLLSELDQPRRKQPRQVAGALGDYGDLVALGGSEALAKQVHAPITVQALTRIIQHLSGIPGRKSLLWLVPSFYTPPGPIMAMLQRANIVLYPVLIRCPSTAILECQSAARDLAATSGGRAYLDALDLPVAFQATQEDAQISYVLGFYPYEDQLDGKYHRITVKLKNKNLPTGYEIHYRTGYLATKIATPAPVFTPQDLFEGPVQSAGIGLTAQAAPDPDHPGYYSVRLTVDLHDVHLENSDGRLTGSIEVSVPKPSAEHTVEVGTLPVNLAAEQLAAVLDKGLPVSLGGVKPASGEIRVVVRDPSTGAVGSLRIPVASPPPN